MEGRSRREGSLQRESASTASMCKIMSSIKTLHYLHKHTPCWVAHAWNFFKVNFSWNRWCRDVKEFWIPLIKTSSWVYSQLLCALFRCLISTLWQFRVFRAPLKTEVIHTELWCQLVHAITSFPIRFTISILCWFCRVFSFFNWAFESFRFDVCEWFLNE